MTVTQTKSNLIQYNEYYPFGLQTARSWTRENVTGNHFLANSATELNDSTQLYDLFFRNYDPVLGRLLQVDPLALKYASLSPYNFVANNPVLFTDPYGDDMIIMNGKLANPHNPITGEEVWDPFDRYIFDTAIGGGGGAEGISINGQPLTSYPQDASGRYGIWVSYSYTDYSTEDYDPKTGGRLATIVTGSRFVPLSTRFGSPTSAGAPPSYTPPPKDGLPGFPDAERVKQKGGRPRWKLPDGDIIEWDGQHRELERYNPRGKHIGVWNPQGEKIKDGVPGRTIDPIITPWYIPSQETVRHVLVGGTILVGAAIIVVDIVTIPSGEGLIGVQMIRLALTK